MTDYSKLKVVDLKEELGKRGLGKGGLKADLVQRLVEADAQAQDALDERSPENDLAEPPEDVTLVSNAPIPETDASAISELNRPDTQTALNGEGAQAVFAQVNGAVNDTGAAQEQPREILLDISKDAAFTQRSRTPEDSRDQLPPHESAQLIAKQPSHTSPSANLGDRDARSPVGLLPTSPPESLSVEEVTEDSKKRKRRSQSPVPSSATVQKKLKADITGLDEILPEENHANKGLESDHLPIVGESDAALVGHALELPTEERINVQAAPDLPDAQYAAEIPHKHDPLDGMAAPETTGQNQSMTVEESRSDAVVESPGNKETPPPAKAVDPSVKASPSDARFKNLFNGPAANPASSHPPSVSQDELPTTPSIHPATSALYIRELMRPLNPRTVQDHLIALAAAPDGHVDNTVITEFFLDKNRTHCLVAFSSTSVAARVRVALHDRVWPNERDRKPLWADFVPEEKLQKWIQVESEGGDRRGQPQKRWEVVYEEEEGSVKAYLQEVGNHGGGLRTSQPTAIAGGLGTLPPPSESRAAAPVPRDDHGKGFQALDDLFKFTNTKPRLYYAPVTKQDVDDRLDMLDAGRGGGRSDELRRFSFEDNIIVDKGPEYGMRGRGGYRGGRGGGFDGSYRGRSYRGEGRGRGGFRGGGDSYRGSAGY